MNFRLLAACAASMVLAAAGARASVTVTFDELTIGGYVNGAYDGGTSTGGQSGPDLGIHFYGFEALPSGPFADPTPSMFAFLPNDTSSLDFAAGFSSLSFTYGYFQDGSVSVYSGLFGTGDLLATSVLTANAPLDAWSTATTGSLGGVGHSAIFSGVGGGTMFLDTLTFGDVPEPAAWTLLLAGFGSLGVALRRRRAQLAPMPA